MSNKKCKNCEFSRWEDTGRTKLMCYYDEPFEAFEDEVCDKHSFKPMYAFSVDTTPQQITDAVEEYRASTK